MAESPAEVMRRAAKLMRERAEAMPPPPWHAEGRDVLATQEYEDDDLSWDYTLNVAVCRRQDEAEYAASWHPDVALAVAGWLDDAATAYGEYPGSVPGRSLKVALVYLGEGSGT